MAKEVALYHTPTIPDRVSKDMRGRLIKAQQIRVQNMVSVCHFLWEPEAMKAVMVFDADNQEAGMTENFCRALNNFNFCWTVQCYLLTRESNGKNKLVDYIVDIETPCSHMQIAWQIADAIENLKADYLASDLGKNFITAGWVFGYIGNELDEEIVYDMFEKAGSWKLKSIREKEQENA